MLGLPARTVGSAGMEDVGEDEEEKREGEMEEKTFSWVLSDYVGYLPSKKERKKEAEGKAEFRMHHNIILKCMKIRVAKIKCLDLDIAWSR